MPPESPSTAATGVATDFELVRVIDDRFDAEHAAVLVVHLARRARDHALSVGAKGALAHGEVGEVREDSLLVEAHGGPPARRKITKA